MAKRLMPPPPALPGFTAAAAELRRQKIARLLDAAVPPLHVLRGMSLPAFRAVIAAMHERFGYLIINDPAADDLVTMKGEEKFITNCAPPAALSPVQLVSVCRLHTAVLTANASRGFFITTRSFTAEAEQYAAKGAPLVLINGRRLMKELNRSRKDVVLPQTYKTMCGRCGEIVQHKLDDDKSRPCRNGHPVAPSIARAMIIPPRPAAPAFSDGVQPYLRPMSRREIRAAARMKTKPRFR